MFPLGIAYFVLLVSFSVGGALIWTLVGPVILLSVLFVSRWLCDLEAPMAGFANQAQIRRPPSRLEGVSNFRSQVKVRLVDPTTWTGLIYLFAQFPLGIAAFVGIVTTGAVVLALIFSPIIALYSNEPFHIISEIGWSYTINSPLDGLLLTPIGLFGLVLASHMILAFSSLHGWWAKLMPGSRSTRIVARPIPTPEGDGPPKPSTTAVPGEIGTKPPIEQQESESPTAEAPKRFNPPVSVPVAAILIPVPNPSELMPEGTLDLTPIAELTARE